MKIKFPLVLCLSYLTLAFILSGKFSILPAALFVAALAIDLLTRLRGGIKNLFYFLAAASCLPTFFWLFALYLPFAVFGCLLNKKSFIKNYIIGFAISFIPTTLMYLSSTYLSIRLNIIAVLIMFYLMPALLLLFIRKKSLGFFEMDGRECASMLIILSLTTVVAFPILDEKNLFMANGVREFARLQNAVQGLKNGEFVTYNPSIAQGEATFLWNAPSFYAHISLATLIVGNSKPILMFNYQTFFILFLSIISLSGLFWDISGKKEDIGIDMLATSLISLAVGLNFFFLQLLESFKQYYSFPAAYLFLGIIMENPKAFRDFIVLAYLSVLIMLIHIPYGAGVNILACCLFLLVKGYYLKNRSELRQFAGWAAQNKLKLIAISFVMILLPLFYVTPSLIYKDFFAQIPKSGHGILIDAKTFFMEFFQRDIRILSLKYPDVSRIDDHKSGFLLALFGPASIIFLLLAYKSKGIKNFRIFALGFLLNLAILSLITASLSVRLGGFYRTVPPYILIFMGASILSFILFFKKKLIKLFFVAVVFLAFLHSVPYLIQNISNIHKERFASAETYKNELDLISRLPVDGRIMTYGLFSNSIDFGASYLTGRYFSRNERIELAIERTIFEKIHGQHSFGQDDLIMTKQGTELYNYLRMGGYKYLFLDARYPTGMHVGLQMYPNLSTGLYQNGPLIILQVKNVSYAEKVDLSRDVNNQVYKEANGYRHISLSKYYGFGTHDINFKNEPSEPRPLSFERLSPTKVKISGNFNDGDFVVFKEQYFPRWKAYMDGIRVPVYATNHELILIKASKGSSILLEYSVLGIERVIGALSLIGFLCLSFVLLIMSKNAAQTE